MKGGGGVEGVMNMDWVFGNNIREGEHSDYYVNLQYFLSPITTQTTKGRISQILIKGEIISLSIVQSLLVVNNIHRKKDNGFMEDIKIKFRDMEWFYIKNKY